MPRRVLLLNGPPGVGKTTVARHLTAASPGTVCIHGDDLRAFAPLDASAHLGPGSTYRAAAALTLAYLAMGARRVIVDYCFLNRRHVAHYVQALPQDTQVEIVTLWAPLAVIEARERARAANAGSRRSELGEKVAECWRLIDEHRDALGTFLDATTASPATLAKRIGGRSIRRESAPTP